MNMHRDKTEDLFRRKIAGYEWPEAIPEWEEIEAQLSPANTHIPFWRIAVAAILIVGIGGWAASLFFYSPDQNLQSEQMAGSFPVSSVPSGMAADSLMQPVDDAFIAQVRKAAPRTIASPDIIQIADNTPVMTDKIKQEQMPEAEASCKAEVSQKKEIAENTPHTRSKMLSDRQDAYPSFAKRPRSSSFSLGVLASNFSTKKKDNQHNYPIVYASYPPVHMATDSDGKIRSSLNKKDLAGFNHRIPVRVGLTGSYEFFPDLSVETGVIYSFHYATFNRMDKRPVDGIQKLHFLGIPVNLNYRIAGNKHYQVYAGAGAEVNINVHSYQEYKMAGQDVNYGFRDKSPVWGCGIKAGAAWKLIKELELYLEPSVMKYWSHSDLHTQWTDRSAVFNLNFGVRTLF